MSNNLNPRIITTYFPFEDQVWIFVGLLLKLKRNMLESNCNVSFFCTVSNLD